MAKRFIRRKRKGRSKQKRVDSLFAKDLEKVTRNLNRRIPNFKVNEIDVTSVLRIDEKAVERMIKGKVKK